MVNDVESMRAVLARNRVTLLPRANVVATGLDYKMTGGAKTGATSDLF